VFKSQDQIPSGLKDEQPHYKVTTHLCPSVYSAAHQFIQTLSHLETVALSVAEL